MSGVMRYQDGATGKDVPVSTDAPFPVLDYNLLHALYQIKGDYGHTAAIKPKQLRKWGRNQAVGTSTTTIMTLAGTETAETLPTGNTITTMSSSSASDTQNLVFIEGHTSSGTDLTFSRNNTATALTGPTAAALPSNFTRATRARLSSPAVGDIYFHTGGTTTGGVPDDKTTVHMMIPAGEIQTQKASTATSSVDYWLINSVTAGILEKTASWAQVRVEMKLWTDTYFYPACEWLPVADGTGTGQLMIPGSAVIIVPPNHDVRMVAIANTGGIDVVGGMSGFIALVQ